MPKESEVIQLKMLSLLPLHNHLFLACGKDEITFFFCDPKLSSSYKTLMLALYIMIAPLLLCR